MLQFQARCEANVRREAEAELARIRMLEREQIALEEQTRCRAELQEAALKAKQELAEREERFRQRAGAERLKRAWKLTHSLTHSLAHSLTN